MIYRNICKIAKEKGYSINSLEQKAELATGSICKWGKGISPMVKNIKKVADILGCTIDELVGEESDD